MITFAGVWPSLRIGQQQCTHEFLCKLKHVLDCEGGLSENIFGFDVAVTRKYTFYQKLAVKVGGDLLKVGGDSSTAKRCGTATPRWGWVWEGVSPGHWWSPGGLPREFFAKMEVKSSNLVHSEG